MRAADGRSFWALCRLAATLADGGCCSGGDSGTEGILDGMDWSRLLALADRHRLSGWLFSGLETHPLRGRVPLPVQTHWKLRLRQQWTHNHRLLAETARLSDAFGARELEVLHMKGPLLSQRLYGRSEARSVSDIDLLVRRESEVPALEDCLLACGYRRRSRLLGGHRCTRWFTYQLEYERNGIPVELHWSFQRDPSMRYDLARIWRNALTQDLGGRSYRVLSAEDAAVAYTVSVPVDLRLGKLSARTLLEIRLLLERMPSERSWDAWLHRRISEGTSRVSAAVVACALQLFGSHPRLEAIAQVLSPHLHTADCELILAGLTAQDSVASWRQRLRCLRLSDGALPISIAWWGISLPARLLAHPTETRRLVRRRTGIGSPS